MKERRAKNQPIQGEDLVSASVEGETKNPLPYRGAIFDLDGVIATTVELHKKAWERLIVDDLHLPYSQTDYEEFIDGKPRYDGLRSFLTVKGGQFTEEEVREWGDRKNGYYNEMLAEGGAQPHPGTIKSIREFRERGVAMAVISSSENTRAILKGLVEKELIIDDDFAVVVGGRHLTFSGETTEIDLPGKPAPDVVLHVCELLGLEAKDAIGIEDAKSGIEAFKAAGVFSIAIDRTNNKSLQASGADMFVYDLSDVTPDEIGEAFVARRKVRTP